MARSTAGLNFKRSERVRRRELTLYPRSLVQLITFGLTIVVLPLAVALGVAAIYVERATSHSQQAVIFSTQAVRYSLALADILKDLERSARVYQVLADDSLLANYETLRKDFLGNIGALRSFDLKPELQQAIESLVEHEQQLYTVLAEAAPGSQQAAAALDRFADMRELVRTLIADNSQTIERQVEGMKQAAAGARQVLIWEAVAAAALALLLGWLVIPPIIRYMRDLDRSIHQLGTGDLEHKIELQGPRDVRELGRRLEWLRSQLEMLESQKQLFLRHFSHELKTPLASIREGAGLLSDRVAGELNDEQLEIARIMHSNSVQLQQRIEDLLTYSTSMQPFQVIAREPVQLDEQIRAVVHEHRLPTRSRELRVITELEPVTALGDAGRLATVFDNLMSNAVKYSPNGGCIWINLYRNGSNAVIDVRDEGPGISREESERVFEAFYKIHDQFHNHVEGSGLGLSIARQFAMAHGGDIEIVDSSQGAHVRLTLPLHDLLS